ncbi:hypothetical protein H4R24_002849 [Coemansia sp. RSA 988]|nr:hypothetical protein H4R24_002849 [Coemansia sp. RSA 988]
MVALNREESFVVIELGSYTTKAMRDITDINKLPSVCIPTRAGIVKHDDAPLAESALPNTPSEQKKTSEHAGACEPDQDTHTQTKSLNGPTSDTEPADAPDSNKPNEAINGQANASAEKATRTEDGNGDNEYCGVNYIFGAALDSTDASTLERVVDVIPDGFVSDWDALSAFLRHIVTKELGIRISDNNSTIMFSTPALWPKAHLENLAQIAFEHLNAPAIIIVEQPQLAVYGNGAVTGVVVDMGHSLTTVAPVIDSCVQLNCIAQTPVAGAAVSQHLRALLQADADTRAQFDSESVPLEFAIALKESGLCRHQLTPTEDANEEGRTETQTFIFKGSKYAVSKQIMTKALEILVKPADPSTPSLAGLIRQAVLGCEVERRTQLWESIHLTGGSSQFPGIKEYLQLGLESAVLPASNIFALSQTRDIKFCSLPEYFVGWRNHSHWTSFLGACIVAKIVLTDARHLISRAEYNDSGPSIIHTKSF